MGLNCRFQRTQLIRLDNYSQEQVAKPVPGNSNPGESFGKKSMFDLVGGIPIPIPTPLKTMKVSWDHEIPN